MIRHDCIATIAPIDRNKKIVAGIHEMSLSALIKNGFIAYGGNRILKIYGKLNCASGKRMKIKNRVFFTSEQEAVTEGYRPCGHCMKVQYKKWKDK